VNVLGLFSLQTFEKVYLGASAGLGFRQGLGLGFRLATGSIYRRKLEHVVNTVSLPLGGGGSIVTLIAGGSMKL
jgi:hypothetical protein